jgi:putative ATP-dependent endonuclease of OLD family
MHLSLITLRNFRIYGSGQAGDGTAVPLRPGLNVLVGENDSGKSCIIDAIHLVLFDESHGWLRPSEEDFHGDAAKLSIECLFRGITEPEAAMLLEWLSFDEAGDYLLKVTLTAERRAAGVFSETRAGADEDGAPLSRRAREYLCATYLKPLRDARRELSPGRRSRLAQILSTHPALKEVGDTHTLVQAVADANTTIRSYFKDEGQPGRPVFSRLATNVEELSRDGSALAPDIDLDTPTLRSVYEKLALRFAGDRSPGLGSENILFVAAELLLLKHETEWLRLALIEELEAHLDSQAQLRVIQFLAEQSAQDLQLVVSTHSPVLASVVDLEGLLICRGGKVFPMDRGSTRLEPGDYVHLRRFLDATKANLFFAAGVIVVEGPSETILLPALCQALTGKSFAKHGVSLVNVGGVALLRYARIFHRQDGGPMGIPVSCVTDRDVPPAKAKELGLVGAKRKTEADWDQEDEGRKAALLARLNSPDVKAFASPRWTLEFDLALGVLGPLVHQAVSLAKASHSTGVPLEGEARDTVLSDAKAEHEGWSAGLEPDEVACNVYEPLAAGRASKAATAEFLAELVEAASAADPEAFRRDLEADPYAGYLVKAIRHATGTGGAQ